MIFSFSISALGAQKFPMFGMFILSLESESKQFDRITIKFYHVQKYRCLAESNSLDKFLINVYIPKLNKYVSTNATIIQVRAPE